MFGELVGADVDLWDSELSEGVRGEWIRERREGGKKMDGADWIIKEKKKYKGVR